MDPVEELVHLAALLGECDDLLTFHDAEHAASLSAASSEVEALREATPHAAELQAQLQAQQFNYALAVDAVRTLQSCEDADKTFVDEPERALLKNGGKDDAVLTEHAAQLEMLQQAHAAQIDALQQTHAAQTNELVAQHDAALDAAQNEQAVLEEAREAASLEAQSARAALAAERTAHAAAATSLARTLEVLAAAVHANAQRLAPLHDRAASLENAVADACMMRDQALAASAAADAKNTQLVRIAEDATKEVDAARKQAHTLETILHERQTRFQDAHHRLAELQQVVECTVDAQANADALQRRAEAAEADVHQLREKVREAAPLRTELVQAKGEAQELSTILSMHKASAEHAEQERVHAKEQLEEATAKNYMLQHTLDTREAEVEHLKETKRRHTEQLRQLRAVEKELAQSLADVRAAPRSSAPLEERIVQLELELSAKAEEVEAADTRILAALKDAKRLAAQNKQLAARLDRAHEEPTPQARQSALQDRTNTPARAVSPGEKGARSESRFMDRLARFKPTR
ncbi:hypothetical protein MVES_000161 [Malassezia vespertilionis]|uniref:Uncharacterized protein n=2 Tax=Malassezia vespertilionis TaxID=2020962 RepID=A0A2N1JHB5_9BASI|nr:hypothetical protein MVES_000161 [Malassezia vespertilionis]